MRVRGTFTRKGQEFVFLDLDLASFVEWSISMRGAIIPPRPWILEVNDGVTKLIELEEEEPEEG